MSTDDQQAEFGSEAPEDLGARVRGGLRWSLASTVAGRLLTPIVGIALARLLSPTEFGVFAVATIALNALTSLNDLGVGMAIVRWPGNDIRPIARTATTLAVGMSLALFGICFFAAPWFASTLHTPEAVGVLRLLSVGVVIDGIGSVAVGYLNRGFHQKRRAVADWSGFTISMVLTISMAATGFGAWSLAWGRIAGNIVTTVALFMLIEERPPRPGWDRAIAAKLLRFGLPLAGASLLVFGMLNVDYLVVGHQLGTVSLGLYVLAFNLSSFPVNMISNPVRQVSIPAFARMQHNQEELRDAFLQSLHGLVAFVAPVCVLLAVCAVPLITFVYGDRWRPAAEALVFLAILGGFRVVLDFFYNLLVAVGRSKVLFFIQAVWVAALVVALVIGADHSGIRGVGIGHVLVAGCIITPLFVAAVRPEHITISALIAAVARPLAGAAAATVAGIAVLHVVGNGFAGLAATGSTIVAVYAVTGVSMSELKSLPRIVFGRTAAADTPEVQTPAVDVAAT